MFPFIKEEMAAGGGKGVINSVEGGSDLTAGGGATTPK